jgi:hypothetical protein
VAGIASSRVVSTNAWPRQSWLFVQDWSKGMAVPGLRPNYTPSSGIPVRPLSRQKGSFAAWANVEKTKDWTEVS